MRKGRNLALTETGRVVARNAEEISTERKIKHPGVAAICEIARRQLFD